MLAAETIGKAPRMRGRYGDGSRQPRGSQTSSGMAEKDSTLFVWGYRPNLYRIYGANGGCAFLGFTAVNGRSSRPSFVERCAAVPGKHEDVGLRRIVLELTLSRPISLLMA